MKYYFILATDILINRAEVGLIKKFPLPLMFLRALFCLKIKFVMLPDL